MKRHPARENIKVKAITTNIKAPGQATEAALR
jgi:hypothetical protein